MQGTSELRDVIVVAVPTLSDELVDEDAEYEVERIVGHSINDEVRHFRVSTAQLISFAGPSSIPGQMGWLRCL